jgi:long-chain fatty acid transport protein
MMIRRIAVTLVLFVSLAVANAPAFAQGHMLHGVGPINSAMGGAGTALPEDSIAALSLNPALITSVQGNQISFTSEFFKDGIKIVTTLNGGFSGQATSGIEDSSVLHVVPAFGWMLRDPHKKLALGFGLIGLAGFGTDYPENQSSILFAQPPLGFGRIFTDFRETKIPVAFAFQVNPKLSIGASFNVYLGEFAVAPLPYKVFDVDANGNRFYPEAGKLTPSWAVGAQFGFVYQASSKATIGASFTTPQNFRKYVWNSTYADPGNPNFGQARKLDFDLDGPLSITFGTGMQMDKKKKTQLAIDGMFVKYKGVNGFGSPGGIVDGIVYPFGWRNIWSFKAGVQHQLTDKLTVRGGYAYTQTPLRKEVVLTATGAPATFQHHFCGGIGIKMFPFLEAEASFYVVPRSHVVGPFPNLQNEVIGQLDESNKLTSGLIGLNFHF